MDRRTRSLMNLLLIIPALYLTICVVLYLMQDSMIFLPTREAKAEQDKRAVAEHFEPWMNGKGEWIGWQSVDGAPRNVLLVCNGNGGNALMRAYYREYCSPGGNWKTYLLEYPGYGAREGNATEPTVTAAAVDALDTLAAVPERKIWVLGESLGSGVACAAAAKRPEKIAGIILVTPFSSLVGAAQSHYPWLPVGMLLRTRLDSVKNLEKYNGPVAVIVAEDDTTVPAVLGQKLFESYHGPKRYWLIPEVNHDVSEFLHTDWMQVFNWLQKPVS